MSNVIALIPARAGSKGIPGKNFRKLGGKTLVQHAYECAHAAGVRAVVSTDIDEQPWSKSTNEVDDEGRQAGLGIWLPLKRPASLAQDDTPMFDVVKHAVGALGLADEDIIVLLQPTQPLRTPEHIQQAIALLRESGADSVVSVVELPRTHAATFQCWIDTDGSLRPDPDVHRYEQDFQGVPTCRQDVQPVFIRDGTCYVFPVKTLRWAKNIYGWHVRPLIIPPEQSCALDTEADWQALLIRFEARK